MNTPEMRLHLRRLVLVEKLPIETVARKFGVHHSTVRNACRDGTQDDRPVHIPEASGQGFRFNVDAHSGVTWARIPGTWAAKTRPALTRRRRRGDRGHSERCQQAPSRNGTSPHAQDSRSTPPEI